MDIRRCAVMVAEWLAKPSNRNVVRVRVASSALWELYNTWVDSKRSILYIINFHLPTCPSGKGSCLENSLSEMACRFESFRWRLCFCGFTQSRFFSSLIAVDSKCC